MNIESIKVTVEIVMSERKPPGTPPGHGGTPPGQGGKPPGQERPPIDAQPEHPIVIPPEQPPIEQPPVDAQPEHPIVIPPEQPPDIEVPPEPVEPPPTGTLQVLVMLSGQQYVYNEVDGIDIGIYQDPDGRFSERCTRVTRDDCPIRCDFRRMEGRTSVVFGQGFWQNTNHVNLPEYTATISGDELSKPELLTVPSHSAYQRTRWLSGDWPLPIRKMSELYDKKLLPRYNPILPRGHVINYGYQTYTPMGLAGFTGYMPQTGGRGDIGHLTSWQGWYVCHEDDEQSLATVLAQGEAAGTFTWDFCDKDTNAVIDPLSQYPQATQYSSSAGNPFITYAPGASYVQATIFGPPNTVLSPDGSPPAWNYLMDRNNQQYRIPVDLTIGADGSVTSTFELLGSNEPAYGDATVLDNNGNTMIEVVAAITEGTYTPGSGITLDTAHMPACSYLPFLLTGDPYHLENLQRQVSFIIMENPSAPVRSYGVAQPRACGWSARTLAACAKVSPEDPPSWLLPRSIYIQAINDWVEKFFYKETVGNTGNHRAILNLVSSSYAVGDDGTETSIQGYQEDIAHGGLAWISLLHPGTKWDEVVHWHAKQTMARLDPNSGWSLSVPAPYFIKVAPAENQPAYSSWGACWDANTGTMGPYSDQVPVPSAGEIDYFTHMSAGMSIAWQAGCTENEESLTRLMDAILTATENGVEMDGNRAIAGPVE